MILTLFDKGKAVTTVLPHRVTGQYILSSYDQEIMAVEGENGNWYLKSNKQAYLKDTHQQRVRKLQIVPFQTYTIFREKGPVALLYVEPPTDGRNEFTRHQVTASEINIGRSQQAQICFRNQLVSNLHCRIVYDTEGNAVVKDNGSSNGTYVNGEKVTEAKLNIGDVLYVMGLKIIFNGRLLSLNNPHQSVQRNAK
ncbi:FHA domain-containing protein [Evansella sp. AB-rgal1]|uniref:FHA domain-containing protein n=1 Tax=Evansella sp. AB-rgal1 TaxID=3242696 RepID=UPI00359E368F